MNLTSAPWARHEDHPTPFGKEGPSWSLKNTGDRSAATPPFGGMPRNASMEER